MLSLCSDDAFCFNTIPAPQAGLDRMMDAITAALAPYLDGELATDHVVASLVIEAGMVQVTMTAITAHGAEALRRFSGEGKT